MQVPGGALLDTLKQNSESPSGAKRSESGDCLARRWQASEPRERDAVFKKIFHLYYPPVQRLFERHRLSTAEAKDLAQDTMVKVEKGLEEFRFDTRFEVWLFKIAGNLYRNFCRDRCTHKRKAVEVSLDALTESGAWEADACTALWEPPVSDPLEDLLACERRRMLLVAVEALPPQERRCVEMLLGQELKYREIAVAMLIETDTVKAHLFHARQKLREKLSPYFRNIFDDPDQ